MLIRNAVLADLPRLLDLGEQYCAADGAEWLPQRAEAGFAGLLDAPEHGIVLVAEVEDQLIGYAVVTWGWSIEAGGREALLDEMFVNAPSHGYGSALIEAVMVAAAEAGAARVFLETEANNHLAREFWLRRGFAIEESVWLQRRCHTYDKAR